MYRLIISVLIVFFSLSSEASLQVFPTRVLISDQKRVGQIAIRHLGDQPQDYKISAVFYRMMPDGKMVVVSNPKPEERSATKMLRFSPRMVTLPPNIEQVVRVVPTLPAQLPPGDYRAHMYFEMVPDENPKKPAAQNTKEFKLILDARLAIAVPVILRHGKTDFSVKLSNLKLEKGAEPAFSAVMESTGTSFPYGDLYLTFKKKDGKVYPVGQVNGVSSYLAKRTIGYPIANSEKIEIKDGTLSLEFRQPIEEGGKSLCSTEVTIP